MKLRSKRCAICHHWYSAKRLHCPVCDAHPIHTGVHHTAYVNSHGKELVRSFSQSKSIAAVMNEKMLAIANALAPDNRS